MNVTEEKLAIHELCARYTLTLDGHDIEGWTRTFTEDGEFGFGDRVVRGRERIAEYGHVHQTLATRHINTSLLYQLDANGYTATGTSAIVMAIGTSKGYRIGFQGHYQDVLRKVDGRWLISTRWVVPDTLPDNPDASLFTAQPEVATLVQPLLDAYQRLGVPA